MGCGLGAIACNLAHPCVHEATQLVFFSGQDLLQVRAQRRSLPLLRHVYKYLPCMRILFGAEDSDVAELQAMCMASGVMDDGSQAHNTSLQAQASRGPSKAVSKHDEGAPTDRSYEWLVGTSAQTSTATAVKEKSGTGKKSRKGKK